MTGNDQNKILIADDDLISRALLKKVLADTVEAEVLVACDGQEAWDIIQRDFTPLVIADWMMPRINGLELCRKLRQAKFDRYVYIILLTARDDQADIVEGLNAGADDYIRKPFDAHELTLRIKAGQRIIRLEEELASKNEQLLVLNVKLEELARVDVLMQIGNRNSFYESIELLHSRSKRYGHRYGLLICDVDHFKLYNDTQGHQAGDKVLFQIAQAIKNNVRSSDEVFRYGGEEIVVVLPEQDMEGTLNSAQRICSAVSSLKIAHFPTDEKVVTVSVGAATFEPGQDIGADWKQILEQADQALYRAKAEGRNRVCQSGQQTCLKAAT